jgi:hypothetical protein
MNLDYEKYLEQLEEAFWANKIENVLALQIVLRRLIFKHEAELWSLSLRISELENKYEAKSGD